MNSDNKITTAKMKYKTRDRLKDLKKSLGVRSYDAAINRIINIHKKIKKSGDD